jgi:ribonuclease P protein component
VTAANTPGFPRSVRLIKTDDYSSVFNFRKRLTGNFLVVHYRLNASSSPRLGLVVAKKTTRLAVQRNYMKRVLRELFRASNYQDLGNVDLIIRTQKTFIPAEFPVVKQEFGRLLAELQAKTSMQSRIN